MSRQPPGAGNCGLRGAVTSDRQAAAVSADLVKDDFVIKGGPRHIPHWGEAHRGSLQTHIESGFRLNLHLFLIVGLILLSRAA